MLNKTILCITLSALCAQPILASDRGDRIEDRLDGRGESINERLDRASNRAGANGHDQPQTAASKHIE